MTSSERPSAVISLQLATLCLILISALIGVPAQAKPSNLSSEQQTFLTAEKAVKKRQFSKARKLLKGPLKDYPLAPYIELEILSTQLGKVSDQRLKRFVEAHAGEPVADILRRRWLDHLAKRQQWKRYLKAYTPQISVTRQCYQLQALIKTGKAEQAWPGVTKVWLHGESRPRACDPVFRAWERAGQRTPELNWQRIELAMEKNEWRLARYIAKPLSASERTWVERWIKLHRSPRDVLKHQRFSSAHPYREHMLSHAIRRMARFDGQTAMELWQTIENRYPFSPEQAQATSRRIAIALEREPSPLAYQFVRSVQPAADDRRLRNARLRAALQREDWAQVLQETAAWPAHPKDDEMVSYWQARALSEQGHQTAANRLFEQLAGERSYYGFLAADLLELPYQLTHVDTPVSEQARAAILSDKGLIRALELHQLDRDVQARREWRYATSDFDRAQLKAAADLAEQRNWHDQAIFTLARTGFWDDLELRFPLEHQQLVEKYAQQRQIDSSWIFAVIRQESAFKRDARSHAGARGLMQLMPSTARHVAKRALGKRRLPKSALYKADTNIALGSHYLRELKDRLDDNLVLATAAYNAGPHRVDKWLPERELAADIWVELVPYTETRSYVRRVMYYSAIYDQRQGREPQRLSERMQKVQAASNKIAGA